MNYRLQLPDKETSWLNQEKFAPWILEREKKKKKSFENPDEERGRVRSIIGVWKYDPIISYIWSGQTVDLDMRKKIVGYCTHFSMIYVQIM